MAKEYIIKLSLKSEKPLSDSNISELDSEIISSTVKYLTNIYSNTENVIEINILAIEDKYISNNK